MFCSQCRELSKLYHTGIDPCRRLFGRRRRRWVQDLSVGLGRVAPDQDLAGMGVLDDISSVPDVLGGCAGVF